MTKLQPPFRGPLNTYETTMKMKKILLLAALIFLCISVNDCRSQSRNDMVNPIRQLKPTRKTEFTKDSDNAIKMATKLINKHMAKTGVPGMQVAVYKSGELIWSDTFGKSSLISAEPLGKDHLLRIGSVSKSLTAIGLMKLVQQGKVKLDDDIRNYTTEYPDKGKTIRVRHLLSHQSGIRHYTSRSDAMRSEFYPTVNEALSIFKDDPLLFEPGSQFHYSSFGYNLLSAVIEGASGKPFIEYMETDVFKPLGISHIVPDHRDSTHFKRSDFFIKTSEGYRISPKEDLSYKWASGGYLSNAEDLAKISSLLLSGRILDQAFLSQMLEPTALNDGTIPGYGLGWIIGTDLEGRKVVYHNGNLPSGRSYVLAYPEIELSIAVIANTGTGIFFNQREAFGLANAFLSTPDKKALESFFEKASGIYRIETTSLDGKSVQGLLSLSKLGSQLYGQLISLNFHPRLKSYQPIELGGFWIEENTLHCIGISPTFVDIKLSLSPKGLTGHWYLQTKPLPGPVPKRLIDRALSEATPKEIKFVEKIF